MELDNTEGHEWYDSSGHTSEDASLLPYSDGQSTRDKHKKNSFLRRAASTTAKYDKSARLRLSGEYWERWIGFLKRLPQQSPRQEGGEG